MKDTIAIILAAGKGTRMKSQLPKILHKVNGKTLIEHVISNCDQSNIKEEYLIVGHKYEDVIHYLGEDRKYIIQEEQLGTGHAIIKSKEVIEKNIDSNILVLMGDAPLISYKTIDSLIENHNYEKNSATLLTATVNNPLGYGRIVKGKKGNLIKIVEQKDATQDEININEINSGVYCFNAKELLNALEQLKNDNAQKEYYLTDVIEIMGDIGLKLGTCSTSEDDIKAVNSRRELAEIEQLMKRRMNDKLMDQGVTIIDPNNTYIDTDVIIGRDTIIYPGVILEGRTTVGENCLIGGNCRIVNSSIANNVEIQNSTIIESEILEDSKIGPYAHLRPNSIIGRRVNIGDFVEVKNSKIGDDTKASHLTYIGDAEVGSRVNLGCGVVFVNYDGKKGKHKSIVEDDCFIGCNVNLIAPVRIKRGSYIAAGSTITESVDEDTLAIARSKQINKIGYMKNSNA